MIIKIYKLGEDVLRQTSVPVEEVNDDIRALATNMIETMDAAEGVGLAAPQVGTLIRMFVARADDDIARVFINPQITATSEEIGDYDEGCLSIPEVYETIKRPVKVTVQALNEMGKSFTLNADGLLARIIQHEIDHLNGVMFIDRGDEEFAKKTTEVFERRHARALQREKEKKAKAQRIAHKKALKSRAR